MTAERADDRIYFDVSPVWYEEVQKIPGARWDQKRKQFYVPLSWPACVIAREIFGEALDIGPELDAWGWARREWEQVGAKAYLPYEGLRRYQRRGAGFLAHVGRGLLGDDMRLGKTAQALMALKYLPALVLCPATVKHVWLQEVRKWRPDLRTRLVGGTKVQQQKALDAPADVYVISWDLAKRLSRHVPYGSVKMADEEKREGPLNKVGVNTVILDEAHRMADPASKQTRGATYLAHCATDCFALTGTPVVGAEVDLWPILHAIAPHEYPTRGAFIDRYFEVGYDYWGAFVIKGLREDRKQEFFSFLDARFLRRTKEEVMDELPDTIRTVREVEMSPAQAKPYAQMEKHMLAQLDSGILAAGDPLVQRTRLLQMAAATPVLDEDGGVAALKPPSCKVNALLDIVEEVGNKSLVVFAESRKLIELCGSALDKAKVPNALITGNQTEAERAVNLDAFQAGRARVILGTFGAMAEGIDLSRADTTVFLQRSYRLVSNKQAEDRTFSVEHARGREIIDVLTINTAEHRVHEIAAAKGERAQVINRDPQEWIRAGLGR